MCSHQRPNGDTLIQTVPRNMHTLTNRVKRENMRLQLCWRGETTDHTDWAGAAGAAALTETERSEVSTGAKAPAV